MANINVSPTDPAQAGTAAVNFLSGNAIDDDYFIANNGQTVVRFANGAGSACTVTIETPATVAGLAIADQTVVVPVNSIRYIGPFEPAYFSNADGRIHLTLSGGTFANLVAEAVRL